MFAKQRHTWKDICIEKSCFKVVQQQAQALQTMTEMNIFLSFIPR